jgi:hypothetical protein
MSDLRIRTEYEPLLAYIQPPVVSENSRSCGERGERKPKIGRMAMNHIEFMRPPIYFTEHVEVRRERILTIGI